MIDAAPPGARRKRTVPGCAVFFTGLSASGKSTIAAAVHGQLAALSDRPVTVLDGDVVRRTVSPGLGYSKTDRDQNVLRVGTMAADITRSGGIVLCAVIAPYDAARQAVRRMIEPVGGFVLVYVSTPLDVCEARDPKGLYAKARAGVIDHFTGISDPYEPPASADVVIDTTRLTVAQAADAVLQRLHTWFEVGA